MDILIIITLSTTVSRVLNMESHRITTLPNPPGVNISKVKISHGESDLFVSHVKIFLNLKLLVFLRFLAPGFYHRSWKGYGMYNGIYLRTLLKTLPRLCNF